MSETLVVALVSAGGGVLVALLGVIGAQLSRLNARVRRLETRDRLSWLYIRSLIDHGYKHAPGVPLPEPPDGWLESMKEDA